MFFFYTVISAICQCHCILVMSSCQETCLSSYMYLSYCKLKSVSQATNIKIIIFFPSVYLVYRLFQRQGERERIRAEKKRLRQEKEKKKKKWDRPSLSLLGEILLWLGGAVYSYTTVFWDKIEATIATYFAYNNDTFPLFFHWRYICCSFCKWGQSTSLGVYTCALVTIAIWLLGSYCSNSLKTQVD